MTAARLFPIRNVGTLVTAALLGAACSQGPQVIINNDPSDEVDETPPDVSHEHDPAPRTFGEAVLIGADIEDESAIRDVKIVFQRETDGSEWTELRMAPYGDVYYEGSIPGREVSSGGIRYYIVAEDEFENVACLPEACGAEAWHFPVVPPRD